MSNENLSLRDQMLQKLAMDEDRKTSVGVPKLEPVSPNQLSDDEYGSLMDALSAFGKHTLSGATLGGTELLPGLDTEDWAEKNTAERIGASFGEVVGMLAPFGSFGLMAKGLGKAAGALSKEGTKQVIKRSASKVTG